MCPHKVVARGQQGPSVDGASRGGGLPGLRMSGAGRFPLSLHHGALGEAGQGRCGAGGPGAAGAAAVVQSTSGTGGEGTASNTWTPGSFGAVVPLAEACCLLPPLPFPPFKSYPWPAPSAEDPRTSHTSPPGPGRSLGSRRVSRPRAGLSATRQQEGCAFGSAAADRNG